MITNNKKLNPHPPITFDQIMDLGRYQSEKEKFTCSLCNDLLMNPISCSSCNYTYCKECLFSYVLTNNECPKGCETFELVEPNSSLQESFKSFELICKKCDSYVPLTNYLSHYRNCISSDEIVLCWNCQKQKKKGQLQYRTIDDYNIEFNFDQDLSISEDQPFLIQIKSKNFDGFAVVVDDYLVAKKEKYMASVFSQLQIKSESYIKVFIDKKWKFLCNSLNKGITVTEWEGAGAIDLEQSNRGLISKQGSNIGSELVMRESDKKLFFAKGNNEYTQCKVKLLYLKRIN